MIEDQRAGLTREGLRVLCRGMLGTNTMHALKVQRTLVIMKVFVTKNFAVKSNLLL